MITTFTPLKSLLSILLIVGTIATSTAQCPVTAKANVTNIQCGDTVILSAIAAAGDFLIKNDFNTPGPSGNQPGADWSQSPSATYTNPCGPPPPGNLTYMWMGDRADVQRILASNPFDLTTGGFISFYFRYAVQAEASPCEGIEKPEEGIYLQYKTSIGTWTTIDYFVGGNPSFYTWARFSYTIPAGACQPNTQIRWIQIASDGINTDHWGLDSILIVRNDPNFQFDWQHDLTDPSITGATNPVAPFSDTTYIVRLKNNTTGVNCIDSVKIKTALPTGIATANPTQLCANGTSQLNINPSFIPPLPSSCGVSGAGCQGVTQTVAIGTGTVNDLNYSPFGRQFSAQGSSFCTCGTVQGSSVGNCDNSGRTQMIIQASELLAYFRGGQINRMELNLVGTVLGGGLGGVYSNFSVMMGCTNKTEFANNTDFSTGLVTVFNPKNKTLLGGWNNIEFDNAYDWDGISNVVVQICWSNTGTSGYRQGNVFKTTTTNYSTIHAYSCGSRGCSDLGSSTRYMSRPTMRLGICYRPVPVLDYKWTPAAGLTGGGLIKNPVATVPATTDYTVVVSDAKRPKCKVESTVRVTTSGPLVNITPTSATICASGGNVQLTATASPSTAGGTITGYSWSPATGLSNAAIANPVASPAATTTYTVTVTDNTGCTGTATVQVFVNPSTPPPTSNDGPKCEGSDIQLSTPSNPAGAIYSWTGPSGFASASQNPLITNVTPAKAGIYSLVVKVGSCTSPIGTTNVAITPKDNGTFNYGGGTFCKTGSNPTPTKVVTGTFTATPAGLSINATTGTIDLAASTLGTYQVTFKTSGTCFDERSLPVTIASSFKADFDYPPLCENEPNELPDFSTTGGSAGTFSVISANASGLVFANTSSGEIDLTNSTPGTYRIQNRIPAGGGCAEALFSKDIIINASPSAAFTGLSATYCVDVSTAVTLSPTTAGGLFSGAGITSNTFTPSKAGVGTHFIKYAVANVVGCLARDSVSVIVKAVPVPDISSTANTICAGDRVVLTAKNGTAYNWTHSGETTDKIDEFPTTTTIYTVDIEKNGCFADTSITITVNPKPSGDITGDSTLCEGDISVLSASGGTFYDWLPGGQTTPEITINPSLSTTYSVTIRTDKGCFITAKRKVTVSKKPTVSFPNLNAICLNASAIQLPAGTPAGGTYSGKGVSTNQFIPVVAGLGKHDVTYTFTNASGCDNFQTKSITVKNVPAKPDPTNFGPICMGNDVEFRSNVSANGDSLPTYNWYRVPLKAANFDSTRSRPTIEVTTLADAGTYALTVSFDGCTSDPGLTSLTVRPLPIISIASSKTTICVGESLTLTASDNNTPNLNISKWTWTANSTEALGDITKRTLTVQPTDNTTYTVNAEAFSQKCKGQENITIIVNPISKANAGNDTIICAGVPTKLIGLGGKNSLATYEWLPKELFKNNIGKVQELILADMDTTIELTLKVTDKGGCEGEDVMLVTTQDCSLKPALFPPNAFSPNADNANDVFIPYTDNIINYDFQVFSRWGEIIFKTNNPMEGWDGRINGGEIAPQGVYVFIVKGRGVQSSKPIIRKGVVSLITAAKK